jgi:hypothetical protein
MTGEAGRIVPAGPPPAAADPAGLDVVRPAYGHGSLADLLPSVLAVLSGSGAGDDRDRLGLAAVIPPRVRRIAVLLVDGLGYHLLPRAAPVAPVLGQALAGDLGSLRPLTTGFPSTTPTSLVTLGTGAEPGRHGLLGFNVWVPGSSRVLNHIEWGDDPSPAWWQPLTTRFAAAAAAGMTVRVVSRSEFAGSGLTVSAYRGGDYLSANGPDRLAERMLAELAGGDPPVLVYGYHPDLDFTGHRFGIESPQWRGAATVVDRLVARLVAGLPPDAALVVTADHGQIDVPADRRFDCDTDPRLGAGVRLVAGEPRVRYLHTVPGAEADVLAAWQEVLGPAAWVATRQEAVGQGWFGPVPEEHLERVGDVVVVCRDRYIVLASATEPERVPRMVAFHGSWTAAEMVIPLLVVAGAGER